jgi:membrane-associated protease RseP (regulator of RpoE activity)
MSLIGSLISFWVGLYVLRALLKRLAPKFSFFLNDYRSKELAITYSPVHITLETFRWNQAFMRIFDPSDPKRKTATIAWLSAGVMLMRVGQWLSLFVFSYTAYTAFSTWMYGTASQKWLTCFDLVPSSTDADYMLIMWISIIVVLAVHELGHAAAASIERLHIQGVGVFVVGMFPGAFVRIEDSVQYLPSRSQLRVYCAGVWHNAILVLICYALLLVGPYTAPLFGFSEPSAGAAVASVSASSPLASVVSPGYVLSAVNGVIIEDNVHVKEVLTSLETLYSSQTMPKGTLYLAKDSSGVLTPSTKPVTLGLGYCRLVSLDAAQTTASPSNCCSSMFSSGRQLDEPNTGDSCFLYRQHQAATHPDSSALPSFKDSAICLSGSQVAYGPSEGILHLNPSKIDRIYRSEVVAPETIPDSPITSYPRQRLRGSNLVAAASLVGSANIPVTAETFSISRPRERLMPSVSWDADYDLPPGQCLSDLDCPLPVASEGHHHSACLRPLSPSPLSLVTLSFVGHPDLLLEFSPSEIASAIKFTAWWIKPDSTLAFISSALYQIAFKVPVFIYDLVWQCMQTSLSVGLLNMLPAMYLDGGLAFPQFARSLFSKRTAPVVSNIVVYIGTALLGLNVIASTGPLVVYWFQYIEVLFRGYV